MSSSFYKKIMTICSYSMGEKWNGDHNSRSHSKMRKLNDLSIIGKTVTRVILVFIPLQWIGKWRHTLPFLFFPKWVPTSDQVEQQVLLHPCSFWLPPDLDRACTGEVRQQDRKSIWFSGTHPKIRPIVFGLSLEFLFIINFDVGIDYGFRTIVNASNMIPVLYSKRCEKAMSLCYHSRD